MSAGYFPLRDDETYPYLDQVLSNEQDLRSLSPFEETTQPSGSALRPGGHEKRPWNKSSSSVNSMPWFNQRPAVDSTDTILSQYQGMDPDTFNADIDNILKDLSTSWGLDTVPVPDDISSGVAVNQVETPTATMRNGSDRCSSYLDSGSHSRYRTPRESRHGFLQSENDLPPSGVAFQYRIDRAGTPEMHEPTPEMHEPTPEMHEQTEESFVYLNHRGPDPSSSPPSSSSSRSSSPIGATPSPESVISYCRVEGCHATFRGNHRQGNLGRHIRLKHRGMPRDIPCAEPHCGRIFSRSDARLKHYRKHHPWLVPSQDIHSTHPAGFTKTRSREFITEDTLNFGGWGQSNSSNFGTQEDQEFEVVVHSKGPTSLSGDGADKAHTPSATGQSGVQEEWVDEFKRLHSPAKTSVACMDHTVKQRPDDANSRYEDHDSRPNFPIRSYKQLDESKLPLVGLDPTRKMKVASREKIHNDQVPFISDPRDIYVATSSYAADMTARGQHKQGNNQKGFKQKERQQQRKIGDAVIDAGLARVEYNLKQKSDTYKSRGPPDREPHLQKFTSQIAAKEVTARQVAVSETVLVHSKSSTTLPEAAGRSSVSLTSAQAAKQAQILAAAREQTHRELFGVEAPGREKRVEQQPGFLHDQLTLDQELTLRRFQQGYTEGDIHEKKDRMEKQYNHTRGSLRLAEKHDQIGNVSSNPASDPTLYTHFLSNDVGVWAESLPDPASLSTPDDSMVSPQEVMFDASTAQTKHHGPRGSVGSFGQGPVELRFNGALQSPNEEDSVSYGASTPFITNNRIIPTQPGLTSPSSTLATNYSQSYHQAPNNTMSSASSTHERRLSKRPSTGPDVHQSTSPEQFQTNMSAGSLSSDHMGQMLISAETSRQFSSLHGGVLTNESDSNSTARPVGYPISHDIDSEDDRRSVRSIESSATLVSTISGYTAVDIASATFELRKVLQDDLYLAKLYRLAIEDPGIGPERLRRNLGRLLKQMAQDLRLEANKELEKLTSRFVALKARSMAHSIVDDPCNKELVSKPQKSDRPRGEKVEESESDQDDNHIDEDRFEDLAIFRTFLGESDAFQMFRSRLADFVAPRSGQTIEAKVKIEATGIKTRSLSSTFSLDRLENIYMAILYATGLVEPQILPNAIRLRWQCKCGDLFSSDVHECRPGGVMRLKERMQRSGCLNVTITTCNQQASQPKFTLRSPSWLQTTSKRLSSSLTSLVKSSTEGSCLPQHQIPGTANASTASKPRSTVPLHKWYIMICMRRKLKQSLLEDVATDRQLFCFLKQQIKLDRSVFRNLISMKRVQKIFFIKFRLRKGGRAEVREHTDCCNPPNCECLPPQCRVMKPPTGSGEYDCNPCGLPDTWPPVCPELMMHSFYYPDHIDEEDVSILEQLPKKIHCKIDESNGPPLPEGWGLHFKEEVDISAVVFVMLISSLLAGLLFLILWTVLKDDIQGASGVSAYIVGVAGMALFCVATKSESFR